MKATKNEKGFLHVENENKAYLDKDHSEQKYYRDSVGIWLTIPALEKIQKKIGVTPESINPIKAIVQVCKLVGIDVTEKDFNRSKEVLKVEVVADTTNHSIDEWIATQFKNGVSEEQMIKMLKHIGWTVEQLRETKQFKSLELSSIPKPPQKNAIPKPPVIPVTELNMLCQ